MTIPEAIQIVKTKLTGGYPRPSNRLYAAALKVLLATVEKPRVVGCAVCGPLNTGTS